MLVSYRNLIAICAAAIAMIALATAIRITNSLPQIQNKYHAALPNSAQKGLTTDSSFYNSLVNQKSNNPVPAGPTAKAYIVGNVRSGKIYIEHNQSLPLPVASMSKLVTAIVATNSIPPSSLVTITADALNSPPDGSQLVEGEKYTVNELLYPLLLNSSNVAAEALASSSDRQHFLEQMSSYSWEVGMPSTFFADPSGVNPQNVASAKDLFALAQYLYKYRPDILDVTRIPHAYTGTTTDHGSHEFTNIHPFVTEPNFLGGKTGHTPEAGDTMMTILNINNEPIVFVILAADSGYRAQDTRLLISQIQKMIAVK